MDACDLADRYTSQELIAMQTALMADPDNRNPPGSFYIYNTKTRHKLDKIAWAITFHIQEKRSQERTMT